MSTGSPIAAEALQRIGAFYAIEASIRALLSAVASSARLRRSRWSTPSGFGLKPGSWKSPGLAEAIPYILAHWEGLTRFLDDGRIEIDTNTIERTIRPIGLGRKNHLFAGSVDGAKTWSVLASLVNSARLIGIEPGEYLPNVLERIVSGRTKINQLRELLPWEWRAAHPAALAEAA